MTPYQKSMSNLLLFFTLSFVLMHLVCFSSVYADKYYVAPQGDDNNEGTIEKPFATIEMGIYRSIPGDTVYLREGRYELS